MSIDSTLTVTDGSSIDGNTATVISPAFALASGLLVDCQVIKSTIDHCKRETSR